MSDINHSLENEDIIHPAKWKSNINYPLLRKASEYRYVAVSRNMLMSHGGFLTYGDYVYVEAGRKSGVYQVRDTMASRWINRIDILESPGVEPYKYNNGTLRRLNYEVNNL